MALVTADNKIYVNRGVILNVMINATHNGSLILSSSSYTIRFHFIQSHMVPYGPIAVACLLEKTQFLLSVTVTAMWYETCM